MEVVIWSNYPKKTKTVDWSSRADEVLEGEQLASFNFVYAVQANYSLIDRSASEYCSIICFISERISLSHSFSSADIFVLFKDELRANVLSTALSCVNT